MRVAVVGLGTVGSWLLDAVERGEAGDAEVVLQTTGRDGAEAALADGGFDVLAECVNSPRDGEPGAGFIRAALDMGAHVATSDKWPVALHGVELSALARERGVELRAESTVMSGTPVLGPLRKKLGSGPPVSVRGVVNATVNQMLTDMARGATYDESLARAQADGLAEPDPGADVDGHDETAKAMVLSALLFRVQLAPGAVRARGVSELRPEESEALRDGAVVRSVTTLSRAADGTVDAVVEPVILEGDDPLREVEGVDNCLAVTTGEGEVLTFIGPGAGPEIAGKGVLDDLEALAATRP